MRKLLTFTVLILLAGAAWAQTLYIANNNTGALGGANTYTGTSALTDAIANAANGDIIYVIPSPTSYGDVVISKQLTLYGVGFNPDSNNSLTSKMGVGFIDITSSNVRISGFTIPGNIVATGVISNITIDKCVFQRFTNRNRDAQGTILIQNNIIGQNTTIPEVMDFGFASSSVSIYNNIIYSSNSIYEGAILASDGTIVKNNIFIGPGGDGNKAFSNLNNCTVMNNIFYGTQPSQNGAAGTFTNNTFEFNMSFGATDNTFSTLDGNTSANDLPDTDPLFVNLPNGKTYSFSYDPNLSATSQGIGTGEAGTDRGVFGGGSPFDVNGTPLPLIQVISLPPTITQGDSLRVNIKGRGN